MKINLLPWRAIRHKKRLKRLWFEGVFMFILTILGSAIWQFNCYQELAIEKNKQVLIKKEIVSLSSEYANVES